MPAHDSLFGAVARMRGGHKVHRIPVIHAIGRTGGTAADAMGRLTVVPP